MKSSIKYGFITWLLLLLGSTMLLASLPADDDFNPSSPPEPNVRFKVEVVSSPYAYSSGSGKYLQGRMFISVRLPAMRTTSFLIGRRMVKDIPTSSISHTQ